MQCTSNVYTVRVISLLAHTLCISSVRTMNREERLITELSLTTRGREAAHGGACQVLRPLYFANICVHTQEYTRVEWNQCLTCVPCCVEMCSLKQSQRPQSEVRLWEVTPGSSRTRP